MTEKTQINCPNCGHEINVSDLLYHQVRDELKREYQANLAEKLTDIDRDRAQLELEKAALKKDVAVSIRKGIAEKEADLRKHLKVEIEREQSAAMESMQEQLDEKSSQLKELNRSKIEVERLKREKEEIKASIDLKLEKRLTERLATERENIQKNEQERTQMDIKEREKIITDLTDKLKDAQRQAEQGSMQLQGEVQELAIEEWLRKNFPLDKVDEVKKGQSGADCLQTVNTVERNECGTIYYESKRTKSFNKKWIGKFKKDIQAKGANIGVLVTEAMPKEMGRVGQRDGIWVCTFEEFKGLSMVLRDSLIKISHSRVVSENRGEKMGMLYDFLISEEFKDQVQCIVEGFSTLKSDLDREKRSMELLWSEREKQIDKVMLNTTHMYGTIRGIAGSAVKRVPQLEMPIEAIEEK